jgi:polyisoprenoid-binding protein YceI
LRLKQAAPEELIVRALLVGFAPLLLSVDLSYAQPAAVDAPAASALYEIDAEASDIYWFVYRAGAFARFGHNHVISVGELSGNVLLQPELEQSRFEIEIPVARLVVDDPQLRAQEGEEFSSVPSEEDIAGTRQNMLSEDVLNADQHPFLRITGTGPSGPPGEQTLDATIELLGRSIPVSLPTVVQVEDDTIEASGTFTLTHEMLGMMPFSVMMGALQVGEPLDFTYRVTARRTE